MFSMSYEPYDMGETDTNTDEIIWSSTVEVVCMLDNES